jgi:hypothetical protein
VKRPIAALAVALMMLGSNPQAEANPTCRSVRGTFDLIPVTDSTCVSPVGVCGKGTFRGQLRGPYVSVLTSIVPTADTAQTNVVLITGDTPLQARLGSKQGTLTFKDSGAFHTTGDGEFAELFSVVSGTGDFAGATGTLFATGTFDFAAGGEGEYSGTLCAP